jgi:hypothetical protein
MASVTSYPPVGWSLTGYSSPREKKNEGPPRRRDEAAHTALLLLLSPLAVEDQSRAGVDPGVGCGSSPSGLRCR